MSEAFVLPMANDEILAIRGPFSVPPILNEDTSDIIVTLPFWPRRKTLLLFAQLYSELHGSLQDKTPQALLTELLITHAPYEDPCLHKSIQEKSNVHLWTVLPKLQESRDSVKETLAQALNEDASVLFTYNSAAAEAELKLCGDIHKLEDSSFVLKSGKKYRRYTYDRVSEVLLIEGGTTAGGIPALRVKSRNPETGGGVALELGSDFRWSESP